MAKTSLVVKQKRPQKYAVRNYTRCNRCGRPRAVFKRFGLCRICLREQIIFPEINYDDIQQVRGLDVTITTTAETDDHARALLLAIGLPFSGVSEREDQ